MKDVSEKASLIHGMAWHSKPLAGLLRFRHTEDKDRALKLLENLHTLVFTFVYVLFFDFIFMRFLMLLFLTLFFFCYC